MAMDFTEYQLLTVQEAAQLLRCSQSTVYRAVHDHSLRWFRVRENGPIKIPAKELAKLIEPELMRVARSRPLYMEMIGYRS
jgi:excisionase family DNA binding protein